MTRQREWEEQWLRIVSLLQRCRASVALSLAEAQELFDAMPDQSLTPTFMRSVVSQVLHQRSEQLQSTASCWLSDLVFSADTLARVDTRWTEPPSVIGVHGGGPSMEGMTVVRSDDVDTGRVTWPWPNRGLESGLPPTGLIVFDVSLGFHELGRSEFCRVRQGTVLSDVYLDGRGLDTCQFGSQDTSWCGGTDREWDTRARIRDN